MSKQHPENRVESLVIRFKKPAAAEHFIRQGTALFGASGSHCCKFKRRDGFDLCYNCNRCGHQQIICTHPTRFGIYSNRITQGAAVRGLHLDVQHVQGNTLALIRDVSPTLYTSRRLRSRADAGRIGKQGNERGGKQRLFFGPSLSPGMEQERRQAFVEADETMTGVRR